MEQSIVNGFKNTLKKLRRRDLYGRGLSFKIKENERVDVELLQELFDEQIPNCKFEITLNDNQLTVILLKKENNK